VIDYKLNGGTTAAGIPSAATCGARAIMAMAGMFRPSPAPRTSTAGHLRAASGAPNPFNPTTTISYQLPVNSRVRLAVYDLAGRLVAELVNSAVNAGVHQVTWDASGTPSGIYFCRLEAGDFRAAQKVVLLK